MKCRLLDQTSENCKPYTVSEARALIGKRVEYLRSLDVDRSGRGYIFPRRGTVDDARGRNISIDGEWDALTSFVEMRMLPDC